MATWDRNFTGGQNPSRWHARLDYWVDGQDANTNSSLIRLRMYIWGDGGYSQTGLWVPRARSSFAGQFGGNYNGTIGSGFHLVVSWDGWVGHDANGNLYVTLGTYANAPINDMAWSDIGWQLPRIGRAPGIAAISADTVRVSSVRLGAEITDFGIGTNAAMRMYYRKVGQTTWAQTEDQNDAAGFNYWTITGLKQATTYEYFTRVWNNNGDTRDSGVQSFKTKSATNLLTSLLS